jgi:hypothetical protein
MARQVLAIVLGVLGFAASAATAPPPAADVERTYLAENQRAMGRMMAAMTIRPAHDIDRDFAAMMIPHHQGAVNMAVLELRYGRNEQLRRIAQEIIVDQQQEIAAMRLALGEPLPPSAPAPTGPARSMGGMDMPDGAGR